MNDTNDELPREIGKLLFEGSSNTHNLRYYDSRSNIKISDKFQKGNCMYNIIQAWNQADSSLKSAGNLWSLKKLLKEKTSNGEKICQKRNCQICNLDANTFQFVWQFLPRRGQSSAVSAPIYLEHDEYVLVFVQVGLKMSERIQMSSVPIHATDFKMVSKELHSHRKCLY